MERTMHRFELRLDDTEDGSVVAVSVVAHKQNHSTEECELGLDEEKQQQQQQQHQEEKRRIGINVISQDKQQEAPRSVFQRMEDGANNSTHQSPFSAATCSTSTPLLLSSTAAAAAATPTPLTTPIAAASAIAATGATAAAAAAVGSIIDFSITLDGYPCRDLCATNLEFTGQTNWFSSLNLCHLLISSQGRREFLQPANSVLELGSGLGRAGILAAKIMQWQQQQQQQHQTKQQQQQQQQQQQSNEKTTNLLRPRHRRVVLTDGEPRVLRLLERNCHLNDLQPSLSSSSSSLSSWSWKHESSSHSTTTVATTTNSDDNTIDDNMEEPDKNCIFQNDSTVQDATTRRFTKRATNDPNDDNTTNISSNTMNDAGAVQLEVRQLWFGGPKEQQPAIYTKKAAATDTSTIILSDDDDDDDDSFEGFDLIMAADVLYERVAPQLFSTVSQLLNRSGTTTKPTAAATATARENGHFLLAYTRRGTYSEEELLSVGRGCGLQGRRLSDYNIDLWGDNAVDMDCDFWCHAIFVFQPIDNTAMAG